MGDQDFTVSGFGTPTAWIVTVSHTGDGSLIGVGFGMPDGGGGTDSTWAGAAGEHNDTTLAIWASDSDSQFEAQALDYVGPTTTTEILEAVGTTITDGVRLTYTTAPTAKALTVRVDLIQCDDAFVSTENSVNNEVNGAGFEGNVVFVCSSGGLAAASGWRPIYGFVADDGSTIYQCCAIGGFTSTTAATPTMHVDTGRFLAFTNTALIKSSWSFTAFDADGYTFADSEGATNINFGSLILKVADLDLWAGALQTGTSVATTTYTDPGFAIGGGFFIPTLVTTANSTRTDATAGATGYGVFTGSEQGCAAVVNQDNVDPSNTESLVSTTQGLVALADAGGVAYAATIASASGGFSAAFTVANGTAAYFLAFVWAAGDLFEAIDETEGITEQVLGAAFAAIPETLSITEEVVYATFAAIMEGDSYTGEGGNTGVETGQGGHTGVTEGE